MIRWLVMPKLLLRLVDGALQPVDHGAEGDAAREMGLGIEEHLDMAHALGLDLGEIGGGQIVEILLRSAAPTCPGSRDRGNPAAGVKL